MLVKIFLPGGKSAADVAFLFVHVKNFADALRQGRVDLLQAVGAVFMYRTLTNPKFLRSLTHSGFMFDDIICNLFLFLYSIFLLSYSLFPKDSTEKHQKSAFIFLYLQHIFFSHIDIFFRHQNIPI